MTSIETRLERLERKMAKVDPTLLAKAMVSASQGQWPGDPSLAELVSAHRFSLLAIEVVQTGVDGEPDIESIAKQSDLGILTQDELDFIKSAIPPKCFGHGAN
ncbi:MAG: hypothetical protein RIM33_04070 [Alphaproteobacteria bacterium]